MNRERARELLPIIQAFAEGKTIQCKSITSLWFDVGEDISFTDFQYRIKPEPMEIWVNKRGFNTWVFATEEAAIENGHPDHDDFIAVHFREVTE